MIQKLEFHSAIEPHPLVEGSIDDLAELLSSYPQHVIWEKGEYLHNGNIYELSHDIVKRPSKKGGTRYDVVSEEILGAGSFGTVKKILMTFNLTKDALIFSDKDRAIKKYKRKPTLVEEEFFSREVESMKEIDYFHVKEPVRDEEKKPLLVMKRLPGEGLDKIIARLKQNPMALNLEQRLSLSLELLRALLRFQASGYLHRDLKPENILVDLSSAPISVHIIDTGFALELKNVHEEKRASGSPAYIAPELGAYCLGQGLFPYHAKTDHYSLGLILEELWLNQDQDAMLKALGEYPKYASDQKQIEWIFNFRQKEKAVPAIEALKFKITESFIREGIKNGRYLAVEISSCILALLKPKPYDRLELQKGIECFSAVMTNLGYQTKEVKPEVAKLKTPKLAFPLKKQAEPDAVQEIADAVQEIPEAVREIAEAVEEIPEAVKNQEIKQEAPKAEALKPSFNWKNKEEFSAKLKEIAAYLQELGLLAVDLEREGKKEAYTALNGLVGDLKIRLVFIQSLVERQEENAEKNMEESLSICEQRLKDVANQPCMSATTRGEEINCLLLNLSLAFAGLLVLYLAAGCVNYAVTGRFLFFSQPKAEALTEKLQTGVDDCRKTFEISVGA